MNAIFKRFYKNRILAGITLAFFSFLIALAISMINASRTLEYKTYDRRFTLGGAEKEADDSIVIIALDDQSFASIPEKYPYPRRVYARMIRNLASAGARLIVVDIEFTEPDRKYPENDFALAAAIRSAGNVILAGKIVTEYGSNEVRNSYILRPIEPLLRKGARWGFVNIIEDLDGFIRRYILFQDVNGKKVYPLAVEAYRWLQGNDAELVVEGGQVKLADVPISSIGNAMLIHFRGPAKTFQTYSLANVLDDHTYDLGADEDTDIFDLHREWGTFKDKIVFVGATAEELQDNKFTPFFAYRGKRQKMPGVEVHANALSTLLRRDPIRTVDYRLELLLMLLLAYVAAVFGLRARPLVSLTLVTGLTVGYSVFAWYIFKEFQLWLEFVAITAAIAFSYVGGVVVQVMIQRREKGRVKRVFERYVAKSVVENMLASGEMPRFGGERRELTVLFSDIRSFTTFCEKHEAESVVQTLNEYLTAMVDIIFRYQGTLDKFVGDEIMALYGAPLYFPDHALKACETACDMIASLRELQKRWSQNEQGYFQIGIGINTGTVIVGNLGSQQLFDYTVIGDEVNLAARLEGTNKQYWTTIIISESTYKQAKERARARELDLVRVKGKEKPVRIYELRSMQPLPDIEEDLVLGAYGKGLELYKQREWYAALKEFKRVIRYFPSDGPSRVCIKRCLDFMENPPPEDWDGVYRMQTK